MKAFVRDGIVVCISDMTVVPDYLSKCVVVPIEGRLDQPRIGYIYSDGVFTAPPTAVPETTLAELRSAAVLVVDAAAKHIVRQLTGDKLELYGLKYHEAVAVRTGNLAVSLPFITAESNATGLSTLEVAAIFETKYLEMVQNLAHAEELRRAFKVEIVEAYSVDEVRKSKTGALHELQAVIR